MPLLDGLIDTHERRRSAIVETARRLGSGEIECVRERLIAEDAEFTRMTQAGEFPWPTAPPEP